MHKLHEEVAAFNIKQIAEIGLRYLSVLHYLITNEDFCSPAYTRRVTASLVSATTSRGNGAGRRYLLMPD